MPARPPQKGYSRDQEIRVLALLEKIIGSGALGAGERMHALLRYIVREELGGRSDRIKSFRIATEALGRGQRFDPRSDSIVEAEMTRLRKSLEHYNATLGAADPIRLTIPEGSSKPQVSTGTTILATPTGSLLKPRSPLKEIGRTTLAAGTFIRICLMIAVTALVWTGQSPPKQAFWPPPCQITLEMAHSAFFFAFALAGFSAAASAAGASASSSAKSTSRATLLSATIICANR